MPLDKSKMSPYLAITDAKEVNTINDIQHLVTKLLKHMSSTVPQPSIEANQGANLPITQFTLFSKLPTELRCMIFREAMQQVISDRRIVEIHEEQLEIPINHSDDSISTQVITHLRSKNPIPSLFHTCLEAQDQAWKFFDEDNQLDNELCQDVIPFDFVRDVAHFTQGTLETWSSFWRRCSPRHEEFPLKYEAGVRLGTNLRRVIFDICNLLGDDEHFAEDGTVVFGNDHFMEGLGPGLASFQAIEEIILVVSEEDARIHAERNLSRSDEYFDINEGPLSNSALHPDEGLSSISLLPPKENTNANTVLQEAAAYLRHNLDYYFNHFEYPESRAYFTPRKRMTRKRRDLPKVSIMVSNTQ